MDENETDQVYQYIRKISTKDEHICAYRNEREVLEQNDKLQAMEGNRTAIHEQTNEKQNNRKTQAIKFARLDNI